MFIKATDMTPRIPNMKQLAGKPMPFADDMTVLTVVKSVGLIVVLAVGLILALATVLTGYGEGSTGLLQRSPWQHCTSQPVISVPGWLVLFILLHVIFLILSVHNTDIMHESEYRVI